ncbi:TPA: RDD family protein, partial [Candidatus Daviesbacteria bacterium]|nr:RDD family protein [Candidatus Daviesbacteria bacterium]
TFALREILGKLASGLILGIGYLMVAWDSKKQGLHDKIASTYVVRV